MISALTDFELINFLVFFFFFFFLISFLGFLPPMRFTFLDLFDLLESLLVTEFNVRNKIMAAKFLQ